MSDGLELGAISIYWNNQIEIVKTKQSGERCREYMISTVDLGHMQAYRVDYSTRFAKQNQEDRRRKKKLRKGKRCVCFWRAKETWKKALIS